jgi:hypothetical protein
MTPPTTRLLFGLQNTFSVGNAVPGATDNTFCIAV